MFFWLVICLLIPILCPGFLLQVLVDMVRVPDWAFEAAGQEMRGMGPDAATYHPGLYLTPTQASGAFDFGL